MNKAKDEIKRCANAIKKKIAKQQSKLFSMRNEYRKEEQEMENLKNELNNLRRQCHPHKFDRENAPTEMGRGICIHCGASDY